MIGFILRFGLEYLVILSTGVGLTVEECKDQPLLGKFSLKLVQEILVFILVTVANPTVPAASWICAGEPVLLCFANRASLMTISEDPC